MRILIIEDEPKTGEYLRKASEKAAMSSIWRSLQPMVVFYSRKVTSISMMKKLKWRP